MSSQNILIVEDDVRMAAMLKEYLSLDGYSAHCVHHFYDLQFDTLPQYDLILLDLMLGRDSGLGLLKNIRQHSAIPVIVVSAKSEDVDKLMGFQLGADDYLCKPYSHLELVARIQAVLRRSQSAASVNPTPVSNMEVNQLKLDTHGFVIYLNDTSLKLTSLEYNILKQLMENRGQLVSREAIYQQALTQNREFESRTLDVHISNIRRKIGLFDDQEQIKTVRGKGYILLNLDSSIA